MQHLQAFMQGIIDQGGEGIILRNPASPYEPGRSRGFLKLKTARDAEAKIIRKPAPNVWECILPNGVTFTAAPGTMEFANKWFPEIGNIVTFKHRGFMLGSKRPKNPSLSRLRSDVTWNDVVSNFEEKKPQRKVSHWRIPKTRNKAKGYWKVPENRRNFLLEFAKDMGFDPTLSENWYKISKKQLKDKGGRRILHYHNANHRQAIIDAFPELDLQRHKFLNKFGPRVRKTNKKKLHV